MGMWTERLEDVRHKTSWRCRHCGDDLHRIELEGGGSCGCGRCKVTPVDGGAMISEAFMRAVTGTDQPAPLRQETVTHGPEPAPETVDHPAHYGGADNPHEAIRCIDAWGLGFCLGNVAKYISRAGKKPSESALSDLRKAEWYLRHEIERREKDAG